MGSQKDLRGICKEDRFWNGCILFMWICQCQGPMPHGKLSNSPPKSQPGNDKVFIWAEQKWLRMTGDERNKNGGCYWCLQQSLEESERPRDAPWGDMAME